MLSGKYVKWTQDSKAAMTGQPIVSFISPNPARFENRDNWTDLGMGRFTAACFRIVVVRRRSAKPIDGPLQGIITIPNNSEQTIVEERVETKKYTSQIQETFEKTIASKTSDELSSRLSSKLSASAVPSAEVTAEVLSKMASEISDSLKQSFARTLSFEISVAEKSSNTLNLKAAGEAVSGSRSFSRYIKVWEEVWDFYLYDIPHLSLRVKRDLLAWSELRQTIQKSGNEAPLKLPLFSLKFYEPANGLSVVEGEDYEPKVPDAEVRTVLPLTTPLPDDGTPAEMNSLESFAKLAFPSTREEKKAAARSRSAKKAGRTDAEFQGNYITGRTGRALGRLTGAKKAAAKKVATKRTVAKKAVPKKANKAPRARRQQPLSKKAASRPARKQ